MLARSRSGLTVGGLMMVLATISIFAVIAIAISSFLRVQAQADVVIEIQKIEGALNLMKADDTYPFRPCQGPYLNGRGHAFTCEVTHSPIDSDSHVITVSNYRNNYRHDRDSHSGIVVFGEPLVTAIKVPVQGEDIVFKWR